ncbi:hypothetical protein BCR35DRAFT_355194 [Leucosporidium creatinivorum]|uniref:BTB domain-containing protein n=1 Tax=Leucosporidium creatinivorum TaxID=106004 RepID=A0A1Y2DR81_9BASI|nr:hypothetical protein BCR35DRAFT_355194 [Leucosporidium creatinivorum]
MAKRANEAPQDSATAAPALRLSSNFQSSSADIELRSKDGVRFLVHKANLSVSSTVFADMDVRITEDSTTSSRGDEERARSHPLCNEGISAWNRIPRVTSAKWFREVAWALFDAASRETHCDRCNRRLKFAAEDVVKGFENFEESLGLRFNSISGEGYLDEYRRWVKRTYGDGGNVDE